MVVVLPLEPDQGQAKGPRLVAAGGIIVERGGGGLAVDAAARGHAADHLADHLDHLLPGGQRQRGPALQRRRAWWSQG